MRSLIKISDTLFKSAPTKSHKFNYGSLIQQGHPQSYYKFTFKNSYYFSNKVVNVPQMGDSITEGVVFEYKKQIGDYVNQDELLVIVETDKIKVDVRASESGVLQKLYANLGDTIQVDKPLYEIDTAAPKPAGGAAPAAAAPKKTEAAPAPAATHTPAPSSAPAPTQAAAPPQTDAAKPVQKDAPVAPVSFPKGTRNEQRQPLSKMRLRIAERLKEAQNTYALLTTFQEVDMGNVIDLRAKFQKDFEQKHQIKLGFMSFFIKASVAALREQPIVNAVINGKDIVYRDYIDISVAVATPTGLMVPVLRNCEDQNFAQIEKNIAALAQKGKEGTIGLEDMAGGTFTISNGGTFGSLMGTPIINTPQSAILGMHATINRPVVRGENIVARPMMYLALTYDHRIIDGREAATFLKRIQAEIEEPTRLLLDI